MYFNTALFTEFLNAKEILWLGLDFSHAKFTKKGFDLSQDALRLLFHEWNMLIISDQKKYDIRMSFRKPVMNYDLARTTKANKAVRAIDLLCEHINIDTLIPEAAVCDYVRSIDAPQEQRFALIFIVESFDAHSKTGSVWVALFDTHTRTPVLCEKFLKVPSGFGTKNYWGRVFYNILFDIKSYAFYRWENLIKSNP